MRKRVYVILTMLTLLGLAACGAPETVTEDKPDLVTAVTKEPEDTKAPEAEPTATPEVTEEPVIEPTAVPTSMPEPTATPAPTSTPEPTATPAPTSTPEPTATPEPTSTPEPTATPQPTATPKPTEKPKATATPKPTKAPKATATPKPTLVVVPEKNDTRFEDGMEKVLKIVQAYDDLIKYGEDDVKVIQGDLEDFNFTSVKLGYKTADGEVIKSSLVYYFIAAVYYYNYVNNDTGYYDLMRWTSKQEVDGSIVLWVYNSLDIFSGFDTNNVLMMEAGRLPMFFKSCKSVTGYEFVETDEYSVAGVKSAYIIKLDCDGNRECTAVFSEAGNLLNVITSKNFDNFVSSNFFD